MKILVAVDQTDSNEAMVEFLCGHEFSKTAEFKIIHVVEPLLIRSFMSVLPGPILDEIRAKAFSHGEAVVHETAEKLRRLFPQAMVSAEVLNGFVVESIIEMAETWQTDYIAIGAHGRRGANKFTLGNVARAIVTGAPCSVLLVSLTKFAGRNDNSLALI